MRMIIWKKVLVIFLALVVALSLVACEEEIGEEAGLPSTQDIIDGVLESLDNVRTFQFDMNMDMDMSGEAEGEAFEIAMVMNSSAVVDVENRQMGMDMIIDMVLPDEGEMEIAMEYYLINDVMYISMEIPEIGPMWMKSEMPVGYWEQMSQTESQIDLLRTTTQVKVIGSDIAKGVDCYLLQLTPDLDQLWQIAMQQAALGGEQALPDVPEEFFQEMFRSFSVKQWIAKDTYYFTKAKIDMDIELSAEAMEVGEGVVSMDITMTIFTHDYNEPVSLVLPPEAEGAVEIAIQ